MRYLNGYFLLHPFSGTGLVTKELFEAFRKKNPDAPFEVLMMDGVSDEIKTFLKEIHFDLHQMRKPFFVPRFFARIYWESVQIPWYLLGKLGKNSSYFSTYAHPLLFSWHAHRMFMMLHDTFPWKYKEYATKFFKKVLNLWLRLFLRYSKVQLITVSETSKKDIQTYIHPRSPIIVVYNGVDHLQKEILLEKSELENRWNITGPYIFYMGGYDIRKNIPSLIQIFKKFRQTHPECILVLGGNALYASSLYVDLKGYLEGVPSIIHTGFLSLSEMRTLFHYAELFVHPSKDEGCNIPVGEALMEGTPVAISPIAVHEELWGSFMSPIDFTDAFSGARMLEEAYARREKKTYAVPYTWGKAAEHILRLF